MQITLNQPQIEEAIEDYINARLNVSEGQRLDIDLRATRGEGGYTAIVDVVRADSPATPRSTAPIAEETQDTADTSEETAEQDPEAEAEEDSPAPSTSKKPSIFANMKEPKGRVGKETEAS